MACPPSRSELYKNDACHTCQKDHKSRIITAEKRPRFGSFSAAPDNPRAQRPSIDRHGGRRRKCKPALPNLMAQLKRKNSAAFYDVDGTLIKINIVHAFAFY